MSSSSLPSTIKECPSRLASYATNVIEGGWLCALIATPIFFNIFSTRVFEPDKVILLRSIAVFMFAAWGIKVAEAFRRQAKSKRVRRNHSSSYQLAKPVLCIALVWFLIQIIATLSSIYPSQSFWGSYARLQGLFTQSAYFLIFISIIFLLKTPDQRQRLISMALLSSLPVGLFGILQHLKQDPLPWEQMNVARVISTMGNPIFLAAYLIMLIPLAVHRVWTSLWDAYRGERSDIKWVLGVVAALNLILTVFAWHRGFMTGALSMIVTLLLWVGQAALLERPKGPFFRVGFYLVLLSTQVSCVYFTRSRGPWLGLFAGLLLLALLWNLLRRKWLFLWGTSAIAGLSICFILLLNFTSIPLGGIRTHPSLARISNIFNATAQVRIEIWGGVEQLLAAKPERTIFGYGPETLQLAYYPHYPAELAKLEGRNQTPDRSHNGSFDALVETGILGLLAQLALFVSLFTLGFKKLCLIRNRKETRIFILLMFGGGTASILLAHTIDPLRSWRFSGVALPLGMSTGLGLYLIGFSILSGFNYIAKPPRMGRNKNKCFIVALLACLLAHWIEVNVGIAITASQLFFWICSGLLIGISTNTSQSESTSAQTNTNVLAQKNPTKPTAMHSREKRTDFMESSAHPVHIYSLLAFCILCMLASDFLIPGLIETQKPFLGWLFGMTWIFLGIAFMCEFKHKTAPKNMSKTALNSIILYCSYTTIAVLIFVLVQRSSFGLPPTKYNFWLPPPIAILLITMLLSGFLLPRSAPAIINASHTSTQRTSRRFWQPIGYVLWVGLAVWTIYQTNIRFLQADIWHRQGTLHHIVQGQPDLAITDFQHAIALTPHQDFYLPSLGEIQLIKMKDAPNAAVREKEFKNAKASFQTAILLNPLSPDHQINTGRVYKHYADQMSVENAQAANAALTSAIPFYKAGLKIQPARIQWWNELAWIYTLLKQPQKAQDTINHSLSIEKDYFGTWITLGSLHRVQGEWKKAEFAFRNSTRLNERSFKAHFYLGLALYHLDRKLEANASFKRANQWAQLQPKGQGHLAALFANAGNLTQALTLAKHALKKAQPEEKRMLTRMIARLNSQLKSSNHSQQ